MNCLLTVAVCLLVISTTVHSQHNQRRVIERCHGNAMLLQCPSGYVISVVQIELGETQCLNWRCCIQPDDCTAPPSASHRNYVLNLCNARESCEVRAVRERIHCNGLSEFERIAYHCDAVTTWPLPSRSTTTFTTGPSDATATVSAASPATTTWPSTSTSQTYNPRSTEIKMTPFETSRRPSSTVPRDILSVSAATTWPSTSTSYNPRSTDSKMTPLTTSRRSGSTVPREIKKVHSTLAAELNRLLVTLPNRNTTTLPTLVDTRATSLVTDLINTASPEEMAQGDLTSADDEATALAPFEYEMSVERKLERKEVDKEDAFPQVLFAESKSDNNADGTSPKNHTVFVAIGTSLGFLVLVTLIVLALTIRSRKRRQKLYFADMTSPTRDSALLGQRDSKVTESRVTSTVENGLSVADMQPQHTNPSLTNSFIVGESALCESTEMQAYSKHDEV